MDRRLSVSVQRAKENKAGLFASFEDRLLAEGPARKLLDSNSSGDSQSITLCTSLCSTANSLSHHRHLGGRTAFEIKEAELLGIHDGPTATASRKSQRSSTALKGWEG
jgi:hypothetical protein